MRAYLALGSFEGRSKLYSWLTRIAINSSLMALRKRCVRREASFEPLSCCEDDMPQFQIKDPHDPFQGIDQSRLGIAPSIAATAP